LRVLEFKEFKGICYKIIGAQNCQRKPAAGILTSVLFLPAGIGERCRKSLYRCAEAGDNRITCCNLFVCLKRSNSM